MIAKLKQFLAAQNQSESPEEKAKHLQLAAACLLLEVVYADQTLDEQEAALLPELLTSALSLSMQEAQALIAEAKLVQGNATSLFEFTKEINAQCTLEQKQQLILGMWTLAYADGNLCRYEDQIIRRTAELLYLKHSELIQLRNAAINKTR
ncbi:TerB family tellurite resistance protein [Shewanella insulae]|uniref:TerB family tellurite resistance protein n=1 Tax=Shewanella insulae TaxID=2681496 RepID=A0A6L7I0N9_9GAMM|nr:TerB family tellurite resistance protein [Shewanella insulae]MCG9738879.1 TerB family tellurite resistance protein [Shewanella insulae]MCG9754562.1 TerB family tellurite resistance protein [Shewanella insulae]MXR69524.1 TerB family tellurite resistance protein [Shewanella insulae]